MLYKFRFKVVEATGNDQSKCLTVGKTYEVVDGKFKDDTNAIFNAWDNPANSKGDTPFERLCDWWKRWYKFKLVEEHATNEKIVITVDGRTTLARLYKDGKVVKSAEARCCPEDKFDFAIGANLAYARLMGVTIADEEKKEDPKPKYYSGKVVCVDSSYCRDFTVGKIYEFDNGKVMDNTDYVRPCCYSVTDLDDDYMRSWHYKFIPLVEE